MTDKQRLQGKVAVNTEVTPGPGAISWKDFGTGLLFAVLSSVIPILVETISTGSLIFNWKAIGLTALGVALTYITGKFLAPTQQITTFKKIK